MALDGLPARAPWVSVKPTPQHLGLPEFVLLKGILQFKCKKCCSVFCFHRLLLFFEILFWCGLNVGSPFVMIKEG